jgi:hypothetical protein
VPFVKPECRVEGHTPCAVGDSCYVHYKKLMDAWKKEPRWTTAHNLFKESFGKTDEQAAKMLAYMVFFLWEVQNYELAKEAENGPIE